METRQVSSTVIELLHLIHRSNMMQTTQETLTTAQNERLHTLLLRNGAGRPVLALHIGSQQDSGLQRKYRPKEDCLFVMHGTMPSPAPALLPTTFVLIVVADVLGVRVYGLTARLLSFIDIVASISRLNCY